MGIPISLVEDGALKTESWLLRQPKGRISVCVAPKLDSGVDQLAIAPGQGRNGNDCLVVTATDSSAQLPGFWVMVKKTNGKTIDNVATVDGYLSRGQKCNRLSFWMRVSPHYADPISPSVAQNINVGTYHHDPKVPGPRKETDNWHFYHCLVVRNDLARGDWVHVVLNETPQKQRVRNGMIPVPNPTQPAGNYWELLTRFYIDMLPADSKTPAYPIQMWIDDVQLESVEETCPVQIALTLPTKPIRWDQVTRIPVVVTHNESQPIAGVFGVRSHYLYRDYLAEVGSTKAIGMAPYTLRPGSTHLEYVLFPRSSGGFQPNYEGIQHAITFSPVSQRRPNNGSLADLQVESRRDLAAGPCDGAPAYAKAFIRMEAPSAAVAAVGNASCASDISNAAGAMHIIGAADTSTWGIRE